MPVLIREDTLKLNSEQTINTLSLLLNSANNQKATNVQESMDRIRNGHKIRLCVLIPPTSQRDTKILTSVTVKHHGQEIG